MRKVFIIRDVEMFDILRWGADKFYEYLDESYSKKFNKNIEILDANIQFIKNGLKIKIKDFRNLEQQCQK